MLQLVFRMTVCAGLPNLFPDFGNTPLRLHFIDLKFVIALTDERFRLVRELMLRCRSCCHRAYAPPILPLFHNLRCLSNLLRYINWLADATSGAAVHTMNKKRAASDR
ncbi:hypothetical protein D3C84_975190 [compost metagenome]